MTVMVATDGSHAAQESVRLGAEVAAAFGDDLLLVTVWRELRGDFGMPLGAIIPDLVDVERDHAKEVLDEAKAEAEAKGVTVETMSIHGDAVHEVRRIATERKPRMIVIGSHGQGAVTRALFGSVAYGVVHDAPCPVLLVPASESV